MNLSIEDIIKYIGDNRAENIVAIIVESIMNQTITKSVKGGYENCCYDSMSIG